MNNPINYLIWGGFSLVGGLGIPLILFADFTLLLEGTFIGPVVLKAGILDAGWQVSTLCGTEGSEEVLAVDN